MFDSKYYEGSQYYVSIYGIIMYKIYNNILTI